LWIRDVNHCTRTTHATRLIFLNAEAFNSVHLMLPSRSAAFPHGLENSSDLLGTHIVDHAGTVSAAALIPGFEGRTTYGNRPTGIFIPRFRNVDKKDGDFVRGYSFQGGALPSGWSAGKRMTSAIFSSPMAHKWHHPPVKIPRRLTWP
jgi:choline dehydrogenase-like flavoprotein